MLLMFLVVEPSVVTSPCPLLAAEKADEFLPAACMTVPKGSAWIAMQLNLSEYAKENGDILQDSLRKALHVCVDNGDNLHDQTDWKEPLLKRDSWLNRRLAIAVRGWGDLVALRGDDPKSLQTLRDMEALAEWVCTTLHARSRELAAKNTWCPALDEAGERMLQHGSSSDWRRRWKQAVASVAVRHRNLTSMSPWDIFPAHQPADLRYVDLLPLTRFADSLSFQRDVTITHWQASDFKSFYKHVGAIVRCNGGAGLIAKQV